jgi:hypothetical protein
LSEPSAIVTGVPSTKQRLLKVGGWKEGGKEGGTKEGVKKTGGGTKEGGKEGGKVIK